jgi:MAP/microtubule affinity-regulating kinase
VRNGNPTKIYPAKLKRNMNHEQICDEIARALDLKSNKNIRIFRHGGVEVMEDETKYLIDGDMLYISRGEDFDDSSNFAVYQVTRTLGQGGYGKVVEATHALTKECVAIKLLDRKKISKKR